VPTRGFEAIGRADVAVCGSGTELEFERVLSVTSLGFFASEDGENLALFPAVHLASRYEHHGCLDFERKAGWLLTRLCRRANTHGPAASVARGSGVVADVAGVAPYSGGARMRASRKFAPVRIAKHGNNESRRSAMLSIGARGFSAARNTLADRQ